jgi:dihydroorotate dehydrogenase electron transfer subunit
MAKDIYIGEILKNEELSAECFLMQVAVHSSFADPQPGQFVMIRISGLSDPFLARPLSIYSFSRGKTSCAVEILYSVVGKGTQILAGLIKGSQVEIHGPLGSGFKIDENIQNIVFIAGGMGIAPLFFLAEHLCKQVCFPQASITFYLGAKSAEDIVGLDKLKKLCYDINVCTDDGSMGKKSLVTHAFQKDMKQYSPENTIIYACGPNPMLKSLAKMIRETKFNTQVSLEERMACGVGACMGCAVAIKEQKNKFAYKRVCADGPVFDLREVIWE